MARSTKEAIDRATQIMTPADSSSWPGIAILLDATGLMLWSCRAPAAQPVPAVEPSSDIPLIAQVAA